MKPIVIHGGHVVDPGSGLDGARDLLLRGSLIEAIEPPGAFQALNADRIDASGLLVAPGLIDIHVHLREPGQTWKETISTGTAAAAAGGFTSVCAMPNTVPVIDSPELVRWVHAPERGAAIHVFQIAAATRGSMGEALTDYAELKAAGAVAVSDDGKPIGVEGGGDAIMRAALAEAARQGLPVIQHAEDTRLTGGCSMNAGALQFRMGLRGMSVESESSLIERDIRLLRELAREGVRPHLHVAHLSTKKALDAVRAARAEGLHVTCEVMPHHFALNENAVAGYNTLAKMNPPLRAEQDRQAMIEGILDGTVDCLATDHAPHAAHEKEQEFERAPNGITGLESALGLALGILHKQHGMSLARALGLLTAAPARILSLGGRGQLQAGAIADVMIFDPDRTWLFEAARTKSRSRNTPFEGWTMQGRVRTTISEGRVVYSQQ
jgi:dihydroorotase